MFLDLPIDCSSFYYIEILNLGTIPAGVSFMMTYSALFVLIWPFHIKCAFFNKSDGIFSDRKPSHKGHRLTVRS